MDKIITDIIENDITLIEAAKKYDVQVETLRKYIAGLKQSTNKKEQELHRKYIEKTKYTKKQILEDIINNKLTIKEAAQKHNCSESTIKKYIASIKDTDDIELKNLYEKYKKLAKENEQNGKINGGKIGKKTTSISPEQIKKIYDLIIEHDYTLRQLEKKLQNDGIEISKTNIYDILINNLEQEQIKELNSIFEMHHKNAANNHKNNTENNTDFHALGSAISRHGTSSRR